MFSESAHVVRRREREEATTKEEGGEEEEGQDTHTYLIIPNPIPNT